MKKLIYLLPLFLLISFLPRNGECADVTSLVFSITSSAATSTPNLRVTVMKRVLRKDDNIVPIQGFALESGATYNYYLTKSTTFTVTADYIATQIGVDQATKMAVNTDTAYKVLPKDSVSTFWLK
jgi:hypothetical protein